MKGLIITGLIILVLVGGFFIFSGDDSQDLVADNPRDTEQVAVEEIADSEEDTIEKALWRTTELTDVKTGETFTIDQFDKPVILESFAVWCPTCTKQQKEIRELHQEIGDDAISIGLNTDPNEDRQKVLEHITANNFDWYYAVAPKEVTQSLIDEFGFGVANAPSAPVVIIDENKNARLLKSGVKSSSELKGELRL